MEESDIYIELNFKKKSATLRPITNVINEIITDIRSHSYAFQQFRLIINDVELFNGNQPTIIQYDCKKIFKAASNHITREMYKRHQEIKIKISFHLKNTECVEDLLDETILKYTKIYKRRVDAIKPFICLRIFTSGNIVPIVYKRNKDYTKDQLKAIQTLFE